jgi:predicted MPP superfamily phosphohydrolase
MIGQTFWFLLLGRFFFIPNVFEKLFYFIFVSFLYMFMLIFLSKIISVFKDIDMHKMVLYSIILSLIVTLYGHINIYFPSITRYKIISNKNIKTKFAFITDTHIGDLAMQPFIMQKTLNIIKKENVDFLIIGGDIIEGGKIDNFDKYKDMFLNSGIKTFAVLGNHEYYWRNHLDIVKALENANINVLLDDYVLIDDFYLIGREDKTNYNRKSVKTIINDVDKSKFLLLIDHNPKFFDESVEQNVDLQLSGHTHNGQIFPFNFIVKFIYEKPYGKLEKKDSVLITSSGLSGWGPPIKIGSPVEIAIVEIN